jgi:hypothetical protein
MLRLKIYMLACLVALGLVGCGSSSRQMEWGERLYHNHSARGYEIVATVGASSVL